MKSDHPAPTKPVLAERFFHILAFAVQCNALLPLLTRSSDGDATDLGEANPLSTVMNASVLMIVIILTLTHWKTVLSLAPRIWPALGLVSLALLSTLWSDYPAVTIRRAGSLATITLWAWYITARFELKDVIAVIRQAMWLLALTSLAAGIGLGQTEDGWTGVLVNKNDLGLIMAMGALTFFFTALTAMGQRRLSAAILAAAGFLLCCGLLYLSQSRTAWVTAMVGVAFCVAAKLMHKRITVAIITIVAMVLLGIPALMLAVDQLGAIAEMLGKDSSLTGRMELWQALPSYIAERLWLGHGFGAFWVVDNPSVMEIWAFVGWEPPHAHDGWLDLLLELGMAGFALAALQVLILLISGIRAVIGGQEPGAQYLLATVFALMVHNLAESGLVRPGTCWGLLVIATAGLAGIRARSPARAGYGMKGIMRAA